jgi:hypothetical protein
LSLFKHQSLAATDSYLCAYGEHADWPFAHILDKQSGKITEIDEKIVDYYPLSRQFYSNDEEVVVLSHDSAESGELPILKIKAFGFGEVLKFALTSNVSINTYGYSRANNSIITSSPHYESCHNLVFQYDLENQEIRNMSRFPHRNPPGIYDPGTTSRDTPIKIEVNQFGEIAIVSSCRIVRPDNSSFRSSIYSRVDIFGEVGQELRYKSTLYIADRTDNHTPCGLAVDFDGSFIVLTDSLLNTTEPDRLSVHRCERTDSDTWCLETMNSLSLVGQRFSAADIFVAGGFVFISGITDRGVWKPNPVNPKVSYERFPFMHSFQRSDGRNTDLVDTNFHSHEDEEWSIARAYVDRDFIYLHGFIHGVPSFSRFLHDGSSVPF